MSVQLHNILNKSGFDNEIALSEMNLDIISEMESIETQNSGTAFRFTPGLKCTLLGLPKKIQEYNEWNAKNQTTVSDIENSKNISFIMKEMVKTAIKNDDVDPKRRRYSDTIKDFATFLYMMCGRASYEIISSNLPFPQPSTICKIILQQY